MSPLTRVRIAIARELIQVALLGYAAVVLVLGYALGPGDAPVLLAAVGVVIVAGLMLAHVVAVMLGYPALKRRIEAVRRG